MEGVSGLFSREQVWHWERGVRPDVAEEGRRLLVADVNSAVAAALDARADRGIVFDTHGGGGNLRREEMRADTRVGYELSGTGKPFHWMAGLDASVDGLMLMGHHAKAGTPGAFLPHTWMGDWADFTINGQSVGEIGIEACNAGHWRVPLVLAQGDEALCDEVRTQFPSAITACVKRAVNHDLAEGLEAQAARRLTAEKVVQAIRLLHSAKPEPFRPRLPMRVAVRMKSETAADAAVKKFGVERLDAFTVGAEAARHCDVVKWITKAGGA